MAVHAGKDENHQEGNQRNGKLRVDTHRSYGALLIEIKVEMLYNIMFDLFFHKIVILPSQEG